MTTDIADIVDLDRYPISDLEAPDAEELVRMGRERLAADGVFTLPGFIRPAALAAMQQEADGLCPDAFRRLDRRSGFPPGMGEVTRVSLGCIGYDQMEAESPMGRLFRWEGLTRFVSEVLERRPFHRSADPIASCMVTELAPGDELGWHFDANDGIVTLMLRSPGAGGAFEYAPNVRRRHDLPSLIDEVLADACEEVVELGARPGTLTLFNGFQSLHRVAPVESAALAADADIQLRLGSRPAIRRDSASALLWPSPTHRLAGDARHHAASSVAILPARVSRLHCLLIAWTKM